MRVALSDFGYIEPAPGMAYGVDPKRRELYSLRQARYHAIASDIHQIAMRHAANGNRLKVVDIGARKGIIKKYLDAWPGSRHVDLYGADIEDWNLPRDHWVEYWVGDLMTGYPEIPSNQFDIVICEQVLEHLPQISNAMRTLERILRPGGKLYVGVPIFPHGAHLIRKYVVPVADRMNPFASRRGHLQAFSKRTFTYQLRKRTNLKVDRIRGFRVVSGGILRPLENYRYWWRLNRWLGERAPSLCTEIQVIARKPI